MATWQRRDDWIGATVEDQFVMMNLDVGTYVALNETATATWELLEQPADEDALVAALVARYRVEPDHCRRSLGPLLQRMEEQQLIDPIG